MPDFLQDRQAACRWSHSLLQRSDFAILDCETTDLHGVVCEIGIIAPDGSTLFQSLVNPEAPMTPEARAAHGIFDEQLSTAPRLPDIWDKIQEALQDKAMIVAYNAAFDKARIEQSARRYNLPALTQKWQCAMKVYSQFAGNWNERFKSYTWVPLGGSHRAVGDCVACLERIREMAALYRGETSNV